VRSAPLALALGVLSFGPAARAQPTDATAAARRHAENGEAAIAHQDFERALGEYNEAYRLFPSPLLIVNVARALGGLGRNADAIETLRRVSGEPTLETPLRDEIDGEIARLRTLVGELRITVSIDGARVTVRGREVGVSPLPDPIVVDPGVVEVVATAAGHPSARWHGDVRARSIVTVALEPPEPSPPTPAEPVARVAPAPARPPTRRPSSSSNETLLWISGVSAGVLGATALTIGAISLANCSVGTPCDDDGLEPAWYVADTLGVIAILSGGLFLYLVLRGDDSEEAAATALREPGTLRF